MKNQQLQICLLLVLLLTLLTVTACSQAHGDPAAEAPPPPKVVAGVDVTSFTVANPEQYPPVTATEYQAPSELTATGVVLPDISRSVPVITLASGRVVDIRARLGDNVQKGQVLLRVRSDDVGLGFDAYRKAISDELLARKQLMRAKDLYEHGAIAAARSRSGGRRRRGCQGYPRDLDRAPSTSWAMIPTSPKASWTSWRPSPA